MKHRYLIPIICLLFLPLLSCSAKPVEGDDADGDSGGAKSMLQFGWDHSLKGELNKLVDTASKLETTAGEYCTDDSIFHIDESKLSKLQDAWKAAFKSLKRQEIFFFGPYQDKRYYRTANLLRLILDDSATKGADASSRVSNVLNLPEASANVEIDRFAPLGKVDISTCGRSCKGIPALEYLIFNETAKKRLPYCHMLRKVSKVYHENTKTLRTLWWNPEGKELTYKEVEDIQNFKSSEQSLKLINLLMTGKGYYWWMLNPPSDPRKELGDYKAGLTDLVNGLWQIIEYASGPYRLDAPNQNKPDQYPNSNMTVEGVLYNMEAFRDLVVAGGTPGNWTQGTILYYVDTLIDKPKGSALAPKIVKLIDKIVKDLKTITEEGKDPISKSDVCGGDDKRTCPGITQIVADMNVLRVIFQATIIQSWGLGTVHSDADGD